MNSQDRQAIDGLFARLDDVERNSPPRDAAAEEFIRARVAAQPTAPYYMAQTIVALEETVRAAQQRVEELEGRADRRMGSVPNVGRRGGLETPEMPAPGQPVGGGGFLAGAAQTAMGVASGFLVSNAISSIFGSSPAKAATGSKEEVASKEATAKEEASKEDHADNEADDEGDDDDDGDDEGGGGGFFDSLFGGGGDGDDED